MSSLETIKELDKFNVYREYIKNLFIDNENLFKLVYYPLSSPLEVDLPDNPYYLLS